MVSTVKVSNITTPDGTGNVTFDRPLSGSGASLTSLPAANLTGTVATARLGSGTASSSTFLRGDQTYAAAGGGWSYGVYVDFATDKTIATNTSVLLNFTNEVYDTHSMWNTSTSVLTIPATGDYWLMLQCGYGFTTNGRYEMWIQKSTDSGSSWNQRFKPDGFTGVNPYIPSGSAVMVINWIAIVSANVGDQFRAYTWHTKGSNATLMASDGSGNYSDSYFQCWKIS
jgi:hypothetical protein